MSSTGRLPNSSPGLPGTGSVRFGIFEFDLSAAKLTRKGYPVKLQQQPAQLLTYLIQRAGNLVTRDELHTALWPTGTFVEFDDGLNTAMNRIRRTLGDSAAAPQYIETVPKQGYRFVAPVEYVLPPTPEPVSEAAPPAEVAVEIPETLKPPTPPPQRSAAWVYAAVALVIAGGAAIWMWRGRKTNPTTGQLAIRYTIALPQNHKVEGLAISPAGDQIVYQALTREGRMLYRRYLNSEVSRPIPGTENASFPFFSADGSEVGFYGLGKLQAVGTSGIRQLASIPSDFVQHNAFWGQGSVYFNSTDKNGVGIWRVLAAGGQPGQILRSTATEAGVEFVFGHQILEGSALLYSTVRGPSRRSIKLLDLANHNSETVVERGMGGLVTPTGHLLYYWQGRLFAAPMDISSRKLTGAPVQVLENVAPLAWTGPAAAISRTGTLAYLKSTPVLRTLAWVDRAGKQSPIHVPPATYEQVDIAPDGNHLAIVRQDGPELWTLWVHDLRTGAWNKMLESSVPRPHAIWAPDGKSLIASSARDNADFVNLYRIPVDAPQNAERLTEQPNLGQFPESWSAKANAILFVEGVHPSTFGDIMILPFSGNRRPRPLVASAGWDTTPAFSPEGNQFVYAGGSHGNLDVFLQSIVTSSPPVQISKGGGREPLWSLDGKHIYYLNRSRALMEVSLDRDGRPGEPAEIAPAVFSEPVDIWTRTYSLGRDGRFLVMHRAEGGAEASSQIHVVVNWFEDVKRLAPTP